MKIKEMDKLTEHFEKCFNQKCGYVFHKDFSKPHIDVLLFEPNEEYPFYKLVTMGASDYKMPRGNDGINFNRNEYMLFLNKDFDLNSDKLNFYMNFIDYIASFSYWEKTRVTRYHSFDIEEDAHEQYKAAFIMDPKVIKDENISVCKLGILKKCLCLQLMPITKEELDELFKVKGAEFSKNFYPDNGEYNFLADRLE